MKQKLFLLVLTVFCLAGRGAWAQVFTQGAFTFMVTDANAKTVAVWKASKNITGDLFIPSQVSNDGVTYTVTSVFKDGFKDTDISSVTIPASVDSLGPGCFGSCQKLASINIEASNKTLNMYSGEDGSFYRSFAEKSIFIGRNLKINKEWSPFFSPTSVEFGDEVTYIDDGLFRNDNVYQTKLARVVIGKNVTTIGKNAFSGTGTDASVNEMIVTIGENVTTIGSNAFSGCSKLKSINLPSSLKTICGDAFSYTGLTDITIPSSVDSLGKSCFSRCDNLARINIEASDETLKIANGENGSFYRSFAYKTIFIGRNLVLSQKNNFTFYGVTSVEFGDKVTYINEGLFKNESSYLAKLANVVIGNGVTSIGDNAFKGAGYDVSNEMLVTMGENVTTIGSNAFSGCSKLKSISLPSSLETICSDAFSHTSLTDITIPASVNILGSSCFCWCDSLANICIEEGNQPLNMISGKEGTFAFCYADKAVGAP